MRNDIVVRYRGGERGSGSGAEEIEHAAAVARTAIERGVSGR